MKESKLQPQELDVLHYLLEHPVRQQREIAGGMGISLGLANKALKALTAGGWITAGYAPAAKARTLEIFREVEIPEPRAIPAPKN